MRKIFFGFHNEGKISCTPKEKLIVKKTKDSVFFEFNAIELGGSTEKKDYIKFTGSSEKVIFSFFSFVIEVNTKPS